MFRYLILNGTGGLRDYLINFILAIPIILLSLTLHECAHGWMSHKLGDPTAANLGRLTLNPLKHIDPIGFLCMALFGFGWAKPVPVNSRYYKKPRRDMALTALAGPVTNLLFAFLFVLLSEIWFAVFKNVQFGKETTYNFVVLFLYFFQLGASLNVSLAIFNLLPIPPFDGSRIFFIFLPVKWYFGIMKYERYISLALLVLLWTGLLTRPLSVLSQLVLNGMYGLAELIPFFG